MKDLAKIAILAIATLTFEACSSTRSTTGGSSRADSTGTVNPTSGNNFSGSGDPAINPENGTRNSMVNGTANTTGGGTSTTTSDTGTTVNGGTTTSVNGTTTTSSTAGTNNTMSSANNNNNNNQIPGSTGTIGTENTKSSDDDQQFIHQAAISGMTEVQLSQLALKKAKSAAVKQFASMMVKDHSGANAELKTLAASKSITLPDSSALSQAGMSNSGTVATGNSFTEKSGNNSSTTNAGTTNTGSTTSTGAATTGSGTVTTGATTATTNNGTATNTNTSTGKPNTSAVMTGSGSATSSLSNGSDMGQAEKMQKLNSSSDKDFDNNYVQIMIKDHEKAVNLFEQGSKSSDPQVKAYATKHLPTLKMHLQLITALGKSTNSTSDIK